MRQVRSPWPTGVLAVVLSGLLAGCGVQPTGVVNAGDAPRGIRGFGRLYFVRDATVLPVLRQLPREPATINELLTLLAAGPSSGEQAAGLRTKVPPGLKPLGSFATGSGLVILADAPGLDRSDVALQQISCTLAGGLTGGDRAKLRGEIQMSVGVPPPITLERCPDEIRTHAPVCAKPCLPPVEPQQTPPVPSAEPSAVGRRRRHKRSRVRLAALRRR